MAQIPVKSYRGSGKIDALQVIFTSSQSYVIPSKYKSMDVFLVGGGASGSVGVAFANNYFGGGGGGGRSMISQLIELTNQSITINIGAGGNGASAIAQGSAGSRLGNNGGATTLIYNENISLTANGGTNSQMDGGGSRQYTYPGDGGSGGGYGGSCYFYSDGQYYRSSNGGNGCSDGQQRTYQAKNNNRGQGGFGQISTMRPFGYLSEPLYGGGGGGGGGRAEITDRDGYVNYYGVANPGSGGAGGGTSGGNYNNRNSASASANTGGGSGGAGSYSGDSPKSIYDFTYCGSSGNGGSGIAIIRLYTNENRDYIEDWTDKTINL